MGGLGPQTQKTKILVVVAFASLILVLLFLGARPNRGGESNTASAVPASKTVVDEKTGERVENPEFLAQAKMVAKAEGLTVEHAKAELDKARDALVEVVTANGGTIEQAAKTVEKAAQAVRDLEVKEGATEHQAEVELSELGEVVQTIVDVEKKDRLVKPDGTLKKDPAVVVKDINKVLIAEEEADFKKEVQVAKSLHPGESETEARADVADAEAIVEDEQLEGHKAAVRELEDEGLTVDEAEEEVEVAEELVDEIEQEGYDKAVKLVEKSDGVDETEAKEILEEAEDIVKIEENAGFDKEVQKIESREQVSHEEAVTKVLDAEEITSATASDAEVVKELIKENPGTSRTEATLEVKLTEELIETLSEKSGMTVDEVLDEISEAAITAEVLSKDEVDSAIALSAIKAGQGAVFGESAFRKLMDSAKTMKDIKLPKKSSKFMKKKNYAPETKP
jgi:hypothetical protein